jgi:hypothetical protein
VKLHPLLEIRLGSRGGNAVPFFKLCLRMTGSFMKFDYKVIRVLSDEDVPEGNNL